MSQKLSINGQLRALDLASSALKSPAGNIMRGTERALLIDHLEHVRRTLEFCRDNIDDIRAFVASRKAGGS